MPAGMERDGKGILSDVLGMYMVEIYDIDRVYKELTQFTG